MQTSSALALMWSSLKASHRQYVVGAVKVETMGTGRTRTSRDRVETGRWPGGDHNVGRARRNSQELVEPGGDHKGRPQGSGLSEHRTGGG